ncbi:hypothetical protein BCR41DRAFT_106772 [Lobosporangium transversale]|uniref:Uncharacterized protein n=1 Tax=Lobosporangium transversale TaxID=64571 RepID=A0A1Y2GI34_9FUNG|nr:hypothetical protein BCR41DRAFT_116166 [Lobosporangium transversale]XP_021879748.1 hypothetical protein BCR41DRAFT_106772 [Lobosporangium transversale]ORZ11041.1 hypothetical protein BCR41DRAFT_116166 [Lobosporangium transversale]ORZ11651.1 hypothetical protein BCR41DRAFT_106772 [Lobosporangium transversale]|eukprot:XP_021879558.1 hypothetical protein BCR41DRAFT_116166 [Lobosporangium transversale]
MYLSHVLTLWSQDLWDTIGTINYARGLVISLYLVSWAFSFVATMLTQTNNFNTISCSMSILSCIVLYALSKIIIYLFLMEKVYVVTAVGSTRKDFPVSRDYRKKRNIMAKDISTNNEQRTRHRIRTCINHSSSSI